MAMPPRKEDYTAVRHSRREPDRLIERSLRERDGRSRYNCSRENTDALTRYGLDDAPEDDEPESAEETAAGAEAWTEHTEGRGLTPEEVKRPLGLA